MPGLSVSQQSSDRLAAEMKGFADLGNAFSSPFAVGRAASASGEVTRATSESSTPSALGSSSSYVLPIVIGVVGLVLAVVILKRN